MAGRGRSKRHSQTGLARVRGDVWLAGWQPVAASVVRQGEAGRAIGTGKFAEFSRETAELARSVRFRQGSGIDSLDDRLIHSRIHGDTGLGVAAFGDPPVG